MKLQKASEPLQVLAPSIGLWADQKTDPDSNRRKDLLYYKQAIILDFFGYCPKPPAQVTEVDIKTYQLFLEQEGGRQGQPLAPTTVYARLSQLSSFFNWLIDGQHLSGNPVSLARPKAPKPYQNKQAKSLSDEEAISLIATVKTAAETARSEGRRLTALRDYALLLFYFTTGLRRAEVIGLRAESIKFKGQKIYFTAKSKGGLYGSREIKEPAVQIALLEYLAARDCDLVEMEPEAPIWVAHDNAAAHREPRALTSHGFVDNLKRYAKKAGIGHVHLHQTRHTFARWVGEETGSLFEAQDALGHKSPATTRIYLERVAVKRDRFSQKIGKRLGIDEDEDE